MLLRTTGRSGFIIPLTILSDSFSYGCRKRIFETVHLERVEAFPQKDDPSNRVFVEAKQSTCIVLLHKVHSKLLKTFVRTHPGRDIEANSPFYIAEQDVLFSFTPNQHAVPLVGDAEWHLLESKMHPRLGSCVAEHCKIYAGEMCDNRANARNISDDPEDGPMILRGGNIQRYELLDEPKQGIARYLKKGRWLTERGVSDRGQHHIQPRIAFQKGAAIDNWRRLIMTVVPPDEFLFDTIGYISSFR